MQMGNLPDGSTQTAARRARARHPRLATFNSKLSTASQCVARTLSAALCRRPSLAIARLDIDESETHEEDQLQVEASRSRRRTIRPSELERANERRSFRKQHSRGQANPSAAHKTSKTSFVKGSLVGRARNTMEAQLEQQRRARFCFWPRTRPNKCGADSEPSDGGGAGMLRKLSAFVYFVPMSGGRWPSIEPPALMRRATHSVRLGPSHKNGPNENQANGTERDVDGGYAWVVLAVVFVINASTFGTARAYTLIFDKLARENGGSRAEAAMPFTIMGAIENMAGPLSGYLLALAGSGSDNWRAVVFAGSCLVTGAHLLAAMFAGSQPALILAMGLACGLGLSLVSISFMQLNNAYFVRYRSTAFGLGMTGAVFGTLYISPLCHYFLDNYGTGMCYLVLGLILCPNVPLSLLLRPQRPRESGALEGPLAAGQQASKTVSSVVQAKERASLDGRRPSLWLSCRRVLANPMFHLIWPTQLLFCWLNFVFGMIMVDFGRDRGLSAQDVTHLVPCWAFGQLAGRLCLSSLIDLKFLTYKSFTVICLFAISCTTFLLNNVRLSAEPDSSGCDSGRGCMDSHNYINDAQESQDEGTLAADRGTLTIESLTLTSNHANFLLLFLFFALSMFIALLYILLNGLFVSYVEASLQPLSIGISSFVGSFFLLPRANIIGYYRDTTGNYDAMLTLFAHVSLGAALVWLLLPTLSRLTCARLVGIRSSNDRLGSFQSSLKLASTLAR